MLRFVYVLAKPAWVKRKASRAKFARFIDDYTQVIHDVKSKVLCKSYAIYLVGMARAMNKMPSPAMPPSNQEQGSA
jgi:hypothetical protein